MDARHFDTLTVALGEAGTRRGVLGLLASLPVLGGLFALFDPGESGAKGRRKRRKKRHKHGGNRKRGQGRNGKGKDKGKNEQPSCTSEPKNKTCDRQCGTVTDNCGKDVDCAPCGCEPACGACEVCTDGLVCEACATCCDGACCSKADAVCHAVSGTCCVRHSHARTCDGQCGTVTDNCGKAVDCGACTCATPCRACLVCDEGTGACQPDPDQQGEPCGEPGQRCQADGTCSCDAGSCGPGERCRDRHCVCDAISCDDGCCTQADAVCHAESGDCCLRDGQAATCDGRCGEVTDNCGFRVDCGPCTCTPECGACLVCDEETGTCVADASQEGGSCGHPGQSCQPDGSCACDAGSCAACEACQENGRCSAPCDGAGCCDADGECHDGDSAAICGRDGEACVACDGEEICRADGTGGTCRLNQAPDAFNLTYNDVWGKACIVVTLLGADPDGDPLAFRVLSEPTNGKLFVYDEDAVDHLGVQVQPGDPAVPAEAGTDSLRLCYQTNNTFFFGSDSFRYISVDTHGAESPALPGGPSTSKSYIQINVVET